MKEGTREVTSRPSHGQPGLSSAEAARRLEEFGKNDPAPKKQRSQLVSLLLQFANPLVAILLFASVVSAFVGELFNAAIIVVIVTLSVAVNFVQTFRSQASYDRLRSTVAPTATVLRDGAFSELPRDQVVPGDVVRLSAGDMVPADAKLLETKDLHVQESALTGESMPVDKDFKEGDQTAATMVFLGTSVVSGTATALVDRMQVPAPRRRGRPCSALCPGARTACSDARIIEHFGAIQRFPRRARARTVRTDWRRSISSAARVRSLWSTTSRRSATLRSTDAPPSAARSF